MTIWLTNIFIQIKKIRIYIIKLKLIKTSDKNADNELPDEGLGVVEAELE